MRFVPSAVGEPLRVKHMCDIMCNEKGFKFGDIADTLVGDCAGWQKVSDAAGGELAREPPCKEDFELLHASGGMRLDGTLNRQAVKAGKACEWSEMV